MTKPVQKNRPRLGRGLSSLITVSGVGGKAEEKGAPVVPVMAEGGGVAVVNTGQPLEVLIEQIVANPHQPRKSIDEGKVAELAQSIKSTGLIQPIILRKVERGYQLIAGERRLRAAKLAGLVAIPAIVREVDSFTQAQMALIENIQREDLNPIDRASAYRTLIEQLGLTQAELAGRMGEDRSSIANYLRLLDLAEPVREMVRDGRVSMGHAKLIAGVADILEQERLANLVVNQGLSVRNLERLMADGGKSATVQSDPPAVSAHLLDLEKSIARQLGMRVQVRSSPKKGKGRLVIHYSSLDQFDELMNRMGVKVVE